jgi:hypothetical protein
MARRMFRTTSRAHAASVAYPYATLPFIATVLTGYDLDSQSYTYRTEQCPIDGPSYLVGRDA